MATGEIYIQLSVNFPTNPRVRALKRYGKEARATRDLYVQMLLYCKSTRSDGRVPDDEIGVLVYPDLEQVGKRQAGYLAEVGLIERDGDGYLITGWLQRNSSRDDIERRSLAKGRGARLANHRRWHVEMDSPDPKCEWCRKSDQTTTLTTDQSSDETSDQATDSTLNDGLKRSDSIDTDTDTDTKKNTPGRRAGRQIEPGSDDDPEFCAFWDAYPKRVSKGQARKTWKTLVTKAHVDPKVIILGAERYREDPDRPRDLKYVPNPSTWLNAESWLEQQDGARDDDPGGDEDFWS